MFLTILAYFLIALVASIAIGVLILFIILVIADNEPKRAWPLLAFAGLIGGFLWALVHLGMISP